MRVAVLGSGVVGVAAAYFLARDGHEVVVVDRQEKAAMETSFSNAGMVSPGHAYTWASPRAPKLLWQSLYRSDTALRLKPRLDPDLWRWCWKFLKECTSERAAINTANKVRLCNYSLAQFQEVNRDLALDYDRQTGGAVYIYRDKEHFDRGVAAMSVLTDNGVDLRPVDAAQAMAIEPALETGNASEIAGAIYCPTDESGDCHKFSNALARHLAEKMGVEFRYGEAVRRLEIDGDRVARVETDKGEVRADAYVLALGSYSGEFARQAGARIPLYPVKGYAMTIPVREGNSAPRLCGVDEKYLIAWSRLGDRLRVTATAEFSGYERSHSPRDFDHMLSTIKGLFPGAADYDKAERWAGLRPMTPRGTPILGHSPKKNLFFNTGHGHIGWTMSMGSGSIVADIIAGRRPQIDLKGLTLADAG